MIAELVDGAEVIRHAGVFLLGAVFLYSFWRLPFEYRGPWESAALSMPLGRHLTPKGMVYRKRMFRSVAYMCARYVAWSLILAILEEFA